VEQNNFFASFAEESWAKQSVKFGSTFLKGGFLKVDFRKSWAKKSVKFGSAFFKGGFLKVDFRKSWAKQSVKFGSTFLKGGFLKVDFRKSCFAPLFQKWIKWNRAFDFFSWCYI
jgi:hypothetical protein